MVKLPNKAGKNLTQNTVFPSSLIINEIQDVTGGTDKKPQAK
jgi:hypothetical protein